MTMPKTVPEVARAAAAETDTSPIGVFWDIDNCPVSYPPKITHPERKAQLHYPRQPVPATR
jgi:hypothetical protein